MPDTRDIKNIRSRLELWELTHLRELSAFLRTQLEDAIARASTAEAWAETVQGNAEQLQAELLELADACGATPAVRTCIAAGTCARLATNAAQNGAALSLHSIAEPTPTPPAPGTHWPEQSGTYIGITPAEGDMPARHLVALDIEPDERMTWANAVKWAESQGNGARLPTQLEAVFAFTTSKAAFKPHYHWTGTQLSSYGAFVQGFEYGGSGWGSKGVEHRVRAFRVIPLPL